MSATSLSKRVPGTIRSFESNEIRPASFAGILIGLAAFSSTWTGVKISGLNLSDLLLVLATVFALIEVGVRSRPSVLSMWMLAPSAAGFFLLAFGVVTRGDALTSSIGDQPNWVVGNATFADQGGGLLFLFRLVIATTLVAFLTRSEVDTGGTRGGVRLLKYFAAGASVSALVAVLSLFGLVPADLATYRILTNRAVGLAFHPNSLGLSMVIAVPVLYYLAKRGVSHGFSRFFWAVCLALCSIALFLADSRGAFIVGALAIAILVTISSLQFSKGRWLLPVGMGIVILGYIWLPSILGNTRFLSVNSNAAESTASRTTFLGDAISEFLANPFFGAGLGNGGGVMVPALVASTGGVVLLVAFYVYFFVPISHMIKARGAPIVAHCLISGLAVLVMGLFNNSIDERMDYWTLCIGSAIALTHLRFRTGRLTVDDERTSSATRA